MLASDFLTVETVWLTRIYALFFVSLERRRVEFVASTANPNGGRVAQQARNLLMLLDDRKQSFRFLLHDRDSKFDGGFDRILRSEGHDDRPHAGASTKRQHLRPSAGSARSGASASTEP
jgi:putative transposase